MALINCPECNTEISDKAVACPKCGNPSDTKSLRNGPHLNPVTVNAESGPRVSPTKWWIWIPLAGAVAFLAFGFSIPKNEADAMAQGRVCREMFEKGQVSTLAECDSLEASVRSRGYKPNFNDPPPVIGRWEREALEEAQQKREADATKISTK